MKNLAAALFTIFLFSSCADQVIDNPPPASYELKQNYPNPFIDSTVIEYGIPFFGTNMQGPYIKIIAYDRFRRKQATLKDQPNHPAGQFAVTWNGRGVNGIKVPAGIYYVELHQNNAFFSDNDPVEVVLQIAVMKK
jgi:hypothetical protein